MALSASWLSGLLFLNAKDTFTFCSYPYWYRRLPSLVSLLALVNNNGDRIVGPWHLDTLAWLMAFFVLTIGLIIQRFSVRYLMGDRSYRKYFALFTFTTGVSSVAWLSDDLRLMLICWGATLIGLVLLIGLNKGWKVVSEATKISGYLFTISWIALLSAIIWLFK